MSKRKQIPMREYGWWANSTTWEQAFNRLTAEVNRDEARELTHLLHHRLYTEHGIYGIRRAVRLWIKEKVT